MVSRRRAKPGYAKNGSRRRSIFHRLRERRWRFSQKRIKTEPNRPSMPLPPHSRFLPSNHWFRETSKPLRRGTSGTLSCPRRSQSQRHPRSAESAQEALAAYHLQSLCPPHSRAQYFNATAPLSLPVRPFISSLSPYSGSLGSRTTPWIGCGPK